MSYRVLCDEHVPESTVAELEGRGISATHVTDVPGPGSPDTTVAGYARSDDALLLTNDDDFLDSSDFPDVRVLYYPDNSVTPQTLAERVADSPPGSRTPRTSAESRFSVTRERVPDV